MSAPVDVLAGELRITNTEYSPGITTTIAEAAASLPAGTYWLVSDEARAAVAELIEATKCVDGVADHASFVSDECCCGSRMADHDIGSGHAPVDSGSYYGQQALDRLRAALARVGGAS